MYYVVYFILLSVLSCCEMKPATDKNSVVLKLPREIRNGTFISITGEFNKNDKLSILLSGNGTDEKCRIVYDSSIQNIKVVSKTVNNTTYYLDHSGKDPVSFSLNITARTVMDKTENHFLDLDFEGNDAGQELLPRCDFKLFQSIEYISIKGIQHLRSLLFVFDKVSRGDNEVYGTVLNGQASTAWPEPHLQNEIMFRLPRSLNANDEMEVSGKMIPNPQRLFLNLMTGTSYPDYQNIACQVEASFLQQNIFLRSIQNGNKNEELLDQYPSDLFPDSEFKFIIKVRVNGNHILDIDIGESYAGSIELKHNLRDITYLSLSDDITKVEELKFRYA